MAWESSWISIWNKNQKKNIRTTKVTFRPSLVSVGSNISGKNLLKCENLTYACDDGGKVKTIHNTCMGLYNLTDLNKNVRTFGNVSFCVKEKNKMPFETL